MSVDTKHVRGRRTLRFESLDDILTDANRLADVEVDTLGNWSLGQILAHLAKGLNLAIDGSPKLAAWHIRFVARTLFKRRFLTKGLPAGFQLKSQAAKLLSPEDDVTVEEGLSALMQAAKRWEQDPTRHPHIALGELTLTEWDQLQCRHAELHLSFVLPIEATVRTRV